jgi:transposase-like protein
MDFDVMRKKLDAYKTPGGSYKNIKSELLVELLRTWEEHTGSSTDLARQLGMKPNQLARQIREARKAAVRNDAIDPAFQALQIPSEEAPNGTTIEMSWGGGDKVVKFRT